MHVYLHRQRHIHVYIKMCTSIYKSIYIYIIKYVYMHEQMCICVYTYFSMYMYIYTYYDAGTLLQHTTHQILLLLYIEKYGFNMESGIWIHKGVKTCDIPNSTAFGGAWSLGQGAVTAHIYSMFFSLYSTFFYMYSIFSLCIPHFSPSLFLIFSIIFPHSGNHGIHVPSIFFPHLFHIVFMFLKKIRIYEHNMEII